MYFVVYSKLGKLFAQGNMHKTEEDARREAYAFNTNRHRRGDCSYASVVEEVEYMLREISENHIPAQIKELLSDQKKKDAALLMLLGNECAGCDKANKGETVPCGICPVDNLADIVRKRNGLPTSEGARLKREAEQLRQMIERMNRE